jgi:hypothetical protein
MTKNLPKLSQGPIGPQQQNHLLAQEQTQGLMLQQHINKALTTGPFGNTYEANEFSPKVEAGVVARFRCLQPYLGHRSVIVLLNKALRTISSSISNH